MSILSQSFFADRRFLLVKAIALREAAILDLREREAEQRAPKFRGDEIEPEVWLVENFEEVS